MIDPSEVRLVVGGGSEETPARDYIVVGGDSSNEERDYIIYYQEVSDQPGITAVTSVIRVVSFGLAKPPDYSIQLDTSSIQIGTGSSDLFTLNSSVISVGSGELSAAVVRQIQASTGAVAIGSGAADAFSLDSLELSIGSGQISATAQREIIGLPSTISVGSGSQDLWGAQQSIIRVASGQAALAALRKFNIQASDIRVGSGTCNLLFINLGTGVIAVGGGPTGFFTQLQLYAEKSVILVTSPAAELKSPSLNPLTSTIRVGSGSADLRLIPTGFLPSYAPTSLSFRPSAYGIEKTYSMSGRATRNLLCSKPSGATLTLEYENISYVDANQVQEAYEQSFGTRFGFELPGSILSGQGGELASYTKVTNSKNKWYFDERPQIRPVMAGVCLLSVQLKSRIDG